jgi:hypothetical protein
MNVKSVAQFKSAIRNASEVSGGDRVGKVSTQEMKTALGALPATKAGVNAAKDLLDGGNVKMDAGAKTALKAFITEASGSDKPSRPTGVRTFESVADVKASLNVSGFREQLISAAFGDIRSRSSSFELGNVKKTADGFSVDVKSVHWQTRKLQGESTVHINRAGVPIQPSSNDLLAGLEARLKGDGGNLRELAMKERGALSRSDVVKFGEVSENGRGDFWLRLDVFNFSTKEKTGEVLLTVNKNGEWQPTPAIQPNPGPIGGARPAVVLAALKATLSENARELVGVNGGFRLTRSDAVHVGDIKKNDRGNYDVVFKVAHFMKPDQVRAELPMEVDSKGRFVSAG